VKITAALLRKYNACGNQVKSFSKAYPDGIEASGENAILLMAEGFNIFCAITLLPKEGPGSQRAFALWCAEQVAHLTEDPKVKQCLKIVRAEVLQPGSQNLAAAQDAARDTTQSTAFDITQVAVHDAARDACRYTARFAIDAAAAATIAASAARISTRATVQEAQVFMLGEMLGEVR